MEICLSRECLSESRVCRDRQQTSRGFPENTARLVRWRHSTKFNQLDVRRLRDASVAKKYKRELIESLDETDDSEDPEKHWTDFKTKVLKVSESFLRDTPGICESMKSHLWSK